MEMPFRPRNGYERRRRGPAAARGAHTRRRRLGLVALVLAVAVVLPRPGAGTQGPYRIAPAAVANGGGTLAAGSFALRGSFGQAATATSAAAGYRFHAGLWAPASDVIFASGFDR